MDSRDLTQEQCEWLHKQLSQMAHHLYHIRQRMRNRKFPDDDRMYRFVCEAYEAVWRANMHADSLHCQGKMGTTFFFIDENGIGHTLPKTERQDGAVDRFGMADKSGGAD